jgi:replication factor C subunit 2/4
VLSSKKSLAATRLF